MEAEGRACISLAQNLTFIPSPTGIIEPLNDSTGG